MSRRKSMTGMTRQGVRDLNHIKGKSVGRVLQMPPDNPSLPREHCFHTRITESGRCKACNDLVF